VYLLVIISFKTPFLSGAPVSKYSKTIAALSALLFICHPVQTESVTYIYQRVTSLSTLFYLLSVVAYIKWRLLNLELESTRKKSLFARPLFLYLASIIAAVSAMKTKEIAFTLPVMIALYEFTFFGGRIRRRLMYLFPLFLTMLIIPLTLLDIDKPAGELIGAVSETMRDHTSMSRGDYFFTQFSVVITYIRLIFLPVNQNLDYDYPIYHSFFDTTVLFSFSVLFLIFAFAIYLFHRSKHTDKSLRLISFGILWFFVALSVESSIIPIPHVIFEHRLYLSSVGVFIAIITLIFIGVLRLKDRWRHADNAAAATIFVIVIILTGATYARNEVWKSGISLWQDVINKSPKKARVCAMPTEKMLFMTRHWCTVKYL
jgi:hypothetical protein